MLKFLPIFTLLSSTSAASILQKTQNNKFAYILRQGEEKLDDGSFTFYYVSSDGSKRQEVGIVKNSGTDKELLSVKGFYNYFDPNGDKVIVEYVADENDFQPQGTHISHAISQTAHDTALRSFVNDTKN